MLLTMSGVALIVCGGYVRANITSSFVIVESGDLYAWYLWMSTLIIFCGVFQFLLALVGYQISQYTSAVALIFYNCASGISSLFLLFLGIGCFTLRGRAQALLETSFASSPEDDVNGAVDKGTFYFNILGGCFLFTSALCLPPFVVGVRLHQTLKKVVAEVMRPDTWRSKEEYRLHSMHRVCCMVSATFSFVAAAYSLNSLSYASVSGLHATFPSFLLLSLASGQFVLGLMGVAITKKFDTSLLTGFVCLNVAVTLFQIFAAAVTFTTYSRVEEDVHLQVFLQRLLRYGHLYTLTLPAMQ
jgi:hypothetical protein